MLELKGKYCKDCKIFTDNIEQEALSMDISPVPWGFTERTSHSALIGYSMQRIRALFHLQSEVTGRKTVTILTKSCVCSMPSISI